MRKTVRIWSFVLLYMIIKILNLYHIILLEGIEEHDGKQYLVFNDIFLIKVLRRQY